MYGTLQALAHPDRSSIFRAVCKREHSVGELSRVLGLRQPTASRHLHVLRKANLVAVRSDANRRLYRANHEELTKLRTFLDGFWKDSLLALKAAAESRARGKARK